MNIILLGPPGAGKGTQAEIIEKNFNIKHIATGDILRNYIRNNQDNKINNILKTGELLSDNFIFDIIKKELTLCKQNFILDGYPRTIDQAKLLNNIGIKIDIIIEIVLKNEEVMKRILQRRIDPKSGKNTLRQSVYKRNDDNFKTIKTRLYIYKLKNLPIISYYNKIGYKIIYKKVNGDQSILSVSKEINNILSMN